MNSELLNIAKQLTETVKSAVENYKQTENQTLFFLDEYAEAGFLKREDLEELKDRLKAAKTKEEIDLIKVEFEAKIKS